MPQLNPRPSAADAHPQGLVDTDIIKYLRQFTNWRFKTPLTPDDYFWRAETLKSTITTAALTGSVTYTPPANFNALLFSIEGLIAFNAITAETLSVMNAAGTLGIGNPNLVERVLMKAMNTTLALQNVGRSAKIFSTNNLPISAILPGIAGEAMRFKVPYPLPDGEQLQLDLSTVDSTAAVIGGSYDAGIVAKFLFVRTRP